MLTLILGGARSGKSAYGETLALESGLAPIYLATATAGDEEMRARIAHHRNRRDNRWTTVEEPFEPARRLDELTDPGRFILVDCLTLWLGNIIEEREVAGEVEELAGALARARGPVALVSNEVGMSVVPANALARRFVDEAGRMHQRLAAVCDRVVLLVAGLPVELKSRDIGR